MVATCTEGSGGNVQNLTVANYTFFGDEKLLLPRLTRKSALGTYPKGNDVVILTLRGLDDLKGHEDAGEPAPVVTGCFPGALDSEKPGLGDGDVARWRCCPSPHLGR